MIIAPLNDRSCLGPVTDFARQMLIERRHELAELARQFPTTLELARWIRQKPQVDDNGRPDEGPKVYACRPAQRLRIFWESPNCFERTVEYVILAELIDGAPRRTMATVRVRFGHKYLRHTLPIEDNQAVVLDPVMTRNALEGALFQLDRRPLYVSRNQSIDWMATIAEEPAATRGEAHRVRNARGAMHAVMTGREITAQAIADIAYTVDEADRQAPLFGARGRELHRRTAEDLTAALITQRRRNAASDQELENLLQLGATVLAHELAPSTSSSTSSSSTSSSGTSSSGTSSSGTSSSGTSSSGTSSGTSSSGSSSGQTQIGKVGAGNPMLTQLEKLVGKQGIKQGLTLGGVAIGGPIGGVIGSLAGDALIATAFRNEPSHRDADFWAVKTPGIILDEIQETDREVRLLTEDIAAVFREPLTTQQRVFLNHWRAFAAEWREFVDSHTGWYERMWRSSYDRAIEFRERVQRYRRWFEALTGGVTIPVTATSSRNGDGPRNASFWAIKTPGVILDEINTTDTAVRALDRDVTDQLHEPLAAAQRAFLDEWRAFVAEWREFVDSHTHWYDRMWRGSYDKAIELRESVVGWRKRFEQLGGKPTAPPPFIPDDGDNGGKPGPISGNWKSILLVAGLGAGALILFRTLRETRAAA